MNPACAGCQTMKSARSRIRVKLIKRRGTASSPFRPCDRMAHGQSILFYKIASHYQPWQMLKTNQSELCRLFRTSLELAGKKVF